MPDLSNFFMRPWVVEAYFFDGNLQANDNRYLRRA